MVRISLALPMSDFQQTGGLREDPLFVAMTQPATTGGVPTAAVFGGAIAVVMTVMVLFAITGPKAFLYALVYLPYHAILKLVCQKDSRFLEGFSLKLATKLRVLGNNRQKWGGSTYSTLGPVRRIK